MPKATSKAITITASAGDPVVDLSHRLLELWDAADGAEISRKNMESEAEKRDTAEILSHFDDWRGAVETMVSYARATTTAGALVQLILALQEVDEVLGVVVDEGGDRQVEDLPGVDGHRIERLLRSAIRALAPSADCDSVRGLSEIYGGMRGTWLDDVPRWSREGEEARLAG
jgi:hypothetical protein